VATKESSTQSKMGCTSQPAMKARMSELEQQKTGIEKHLEDVPADLPDVHPKTLPLRLVIKI
jgi:hypothetical protein